MPIVRKIAVNPSDPSKYYLLWSNGRIANYGGAPPVAQSFYGGGQGGSYTHGQAPIWLDPGTPDYFVYDFQITDWVTPSGYVLVGWGHIMEFGTAAPPFTGWPDTYLSGGGYGVDVYCAFAMDPAGNGNGYAMDHNGRVITIGPTGGVQQPYWPMRGSARDMSMDYGTGRYVILTHDGAVTPLNGASEELRQGAATAQYPGGVPPGVAPGAVPSATSGGQPYFPGQNMGRGVVINWASGLEGYVIGYPGWIGLINGSSPAWGQMIWHNWDWAQDMHVVTWGSAGPLRFMLVGSNGHVTDMLASTKPTVSPYVLTNLVSSTIRNAPTLPTATIDVGDTDSLATAGVAMVNGHAVRYTGKTGISTTTTGTHALPVGTLNVTSAASFAASGSVIVGGQRLAYTGKTGATLTGVTGGTGTVVAGTGVYQGTLTGCTGGTGSQAVGSAVEQAIVRRTSRPMLAWRYADLEADPQASWEAAVFTEAQFGIGGFDPATSPALWRQSSAAVATADVASDRAVRLTSDLPNGRLRFYVQAGEDSALVSDWAFAEWQQETIPLPAPRITAIADSPNDRVLLTLDPPVLDTFTRADNAAAVGTSESGHPWTSLVGTAGISGNRAYLSAIPGTVGAGTVDTGMVDHDVSVDFDRQAASVGAALVRGIDSANYLWAEIDAAGTALNLVKRDAGASTVIATYAMGAVGTPSQHTIRVATLADTIRVYLNGTLRITHVLSVANASKYGAARVAGYYGASVLHRWDNFRATSALDKLYVAEYLDDDGIWTTVRGTDIAVAGTASLAVRFDEAPVNEAMSYRARQYAEVPEYLGGDAGSTVAATIAHQRYRLRHPLDFTKSVDLSADGVKVVRVEPQGLHRVLGRTRPVIQTDGVKGVEIETDLWLLTKAAYDAVWTLLGSGDALQWADPFGRIYYVHVNEEQEFELVPQAQPTATDAADNFPTRHAHKLPLRLREVDRPTDDPLVSVLV